MEPLETRWLLSVNFGAAVTTTVSSGAFLSNALQSAVGDVNNDGIPDIIINQGIGSSQVFLGSSTGQFASTSTGIGPGTQAMTLADFNNDGNLDLAAVGGLFLGAGNGTFAAPTALALPSSTVALYAADLNGDGNQDLIAATYTPLSSLGQAATAGITVLLGNGNGTFAAPVSTVVSTNAGTNSAFAAALVFGDFNNDGILDVATPYGVLLGVGNGTFKPPVPLPFSGSGSSTSSGVSSPLLPAQPILAVGDFNGDGNLDLATLPPTGTGQVEILLGTGTGSFVDNGPVLIATGATITGLDADDVDGDGNLDLLTGVITSSGGYDVAVSLGTGTATFGTPTLYAVAGPPINISLGDFNGDGDLDILSLNAPSGSVPSSNGSQIALPVTTASVLLSNAPVSLVPQVGIKSSATRVVAGTEVQYTAGVFPPAYQPGSPIPPSPPPVPTGVVSFYNNGTPLGTRPLVNGRAIFKTIAMGVGTQKITVAYSGDDNYSAANSAPLNQIVLLTPDKTPLVVPSLTTATLPSLFIPNDRGKVSLSLTNGGGAPANGRITINLFLSTDGSIDGSAIPISAPSLVNRAILIGSGKTINLTATFVAGRYAVGSYYIIAEVTPVSGITPDQITQSVFVSPSSFQAAGLVFGTVGAHRGLALKLTDSAGDNVTLTLAGPGLGTVTQEGDAYDVTLTGTTSATRVAATARGGTFTFTTITIDGPLGGLNFKNSVLAGDLTAAGNISNLTFAAAGVAGGGPLTLTLNGSAAATVSLGTVQNVTLNSKAPLGRVTVASWSGGAIDAPRIGTLTAKGEFNPDVNVHGGKLQTATLGTLDGGTWAIAGGIGTLRVAADLIDTRIFAGADSGPDNILGDGDDTYSAATIATVNIIGADTSSLVVAGGAPGPDGTLNLPLTLLNKGRIGSVTVRGAITDDSRFLASSVPRFAILNNVRVATATDPHFSQSQ